MARAATIFFALALLALFSGWIADLITPKAFVPKPARHTPDFYLTDVEAWSMDEQGELQHRMWAERITHYSDDDRVELQRPRFHSIDSNEPNWEVRADRGSSDADGNVVLLQGKVTMERQGDEQGTLHTKNLLLKPHDNYAETAEAVRFSDASGEISAVGLRGYLGEGGHLELLSDMRGRHEPNKR